MQQRNHNPQARRSLLFPVVLTLALVLGLGVAFGPSAIAGDHGDCEASAQECLNARAAKYAEHGWLGVELDKDGESGTYTVAAVMADSPAERAGFRAGDRLVAMQGIALTADNKKQLKAAKKGLAVGKQVTYTVKRGGEKQRLTATLGEVPREVLARWVGEHMLEHHVEGVLAQAR